MAHRGRDACRGGVPPQEPRGRAHHRRGHDRGVLEVRAADLVTPARLGELDDAFGKAKELGNAPDAKVVKYGPPFSLSRFFRIFGETDSKIELTLPKQLIPQLESGRAYFLPSYYAP